VSIAAAFATASAINATLFATARLANRVADDGELPSAMAHRNARGIPDLAVLVLGLLSAGLATIGSLSALVEAASLIFLFTFAVVNVIAVKELEAGRWIPALGAVGAGIAAAVLAANLLVNAPFNLLILMGTVLIAIAARPLVLRRLGVLG
jgi:hypothetical protein